MLSALYRAAATLAAPGLRLMLRRRAGRGKEWADRLPERRGLDPTPRPSGAVLWMHAASVGESVSILPVLTALGRLAPAVNVLLTTGTVTSAELLRTRLPEMKLDRRVLHRFVPLDVPAWAGRFLDHWQPDAAVFVESEIWPNLLAACHARRIPTMLLNARLSERSFARWRRARRLARSLFGRFDRVLAGGAEDAARLEALGARDVVAAGNLKFAAAPLPAPRIELERMRRLLVGRPVWLAASTHAGEETMVLAIHTRLAERLPRLLTIIAPRHPERGSEIAGACGGVAIARRVQGEEPPANAGVYIADTIGELGMFFSLAGIVFVGGSLVPIGGHNPLEPARLGCAVAVGPHTGNFSDAVSVLQTAGALERVQDERELGRWVADLLGDAGRRRNMGEAGVAASARYADLPRRVAAMLVDMIGQGRQGQIREGQGP